MLSLPPLPPALFEFAAAEACPPSVRDRLLSAPVPGDNIVKLTCSLNLQRGDRVLRRIILEGKGASGVTLACNGATIGRAEPLPAFPDFAVEIRSTVVPSANGDTRWERPESITITDCTILGHVRVWGIGQSGEGPAIKEASHRPDHTDRAKAAAPTKINIRDSRLMALGYTPLYLAPGVTGVTLQNSVITGRSVSVAIYLDAESAGNVIMGNRFDIETGREVIAVDGSANNRIEDNNFALRGEGAIRLYRNCGSGGTIRHQTPSFNTIRNNVFSGVGLLSPKPIVVNSREGWRLYCEEDEGYPFGSSLDNRDNGIGNTVENNRED